MTSNARLSGSPGVGRKYRALDFEFGVRCDDPLTMAYLERALAPLGVEGQPAAWYVLECGPDGRHLVRFEDEKVSNAASPQSAVATLLWHVNRSTVRHSGRFVLLHAAAAEADGRAVLLPARMESGKTTTVAGLVRAGLRYLTDEAVAIDPETLLVHPFHKALSVDPGSWEVLSDLRPSVEEDHEIFQAAQWHVDPRSVRADALAPPARPVLIAAPRYEKGARTELRPLSRARALVTMCENSFNVRDHGKAGVVALGEVARRCRCFELVVSDLDRACELVLAELGLAPAST